MMVCIGTEVSADGEQTKQLRHTKCFIGSGRSQLVTPTTKNSRCQSSPAPAHVQSSMGEAGMRGRGRRYRRHTRRTASPSRKLARLELPNMSNGVSLIALRGRVQRGPCGGCVVVVIHCCGTIIARVRHAVPQVIGISKNTRSTTGALLCVLCLLTSS